jgi:hypothetical protein
MANVEYRKFAIRHRPGFDLFHLPFKEQKLASSFASLRALSP